MVYCEGRDVKVASDGGVEYGAWVTLRSWTDEEYAEMTRKYGNVPLRSMGSREYRIIRGE